MRPCPANSLGEGLMRGEDSGGVMEKELMFVLPMYKVIP